MWNVIPSLARLDVADIFKKNVRRHMSWSTWRGEFDSGNEEKYIQK